MVTRRIILIVRDGWGYSTEIKGNAIKNAKVPNDTYYMSNYPWTTLKCTGNAVGLPEGTQGGSEPGHLTIGAGRIIWQPYEEINQAIYKKSFFINPALNNAIPGDPVMPGCLGLDAMWQMVGFYLGWLGHPGKGRALAWMK